MKYFVFSIDDGTIYDEITIGMFNKYGIKGTFNLNSELDNYTWYYEDRLPITRFVLKDHIDLYEGHEVASHTLSHPHLDEIPDDRVIMEVKRDKKNLEKIFNREITSFATPFHTSGEREITIIKNNVDIKNIRLSSLDESFSFPKDPYHILCTAYKIDKGLELIKQFHEVDEGLFVYAGHSYDFYVGNCWDKLETLIKEIKKDKNIKVLTMQEFVNEYYGGQKC